MIKFCLGYFLTPRIGRRRRGASKEPRGEQAFAAVKGNVAQTEYPRKRSVDH